MTEWPDEDYTYPLPDVSQYSEEEARRLRTKGMQFAVFGDRKQIESDEEFEVCITLHALWNWHRHTDNKYHDEIMKSDVVHNRFLWYHGRRLKALREKHLQPLIKELVKEARHGPMFDGAFMYCLDWEFFYRNYPCEDSIYGDNAVYCTHVYAEDDVSILGFGCGQDLPVSGMVNERVDTSHCPSLLELSCTVEQSPDLSGNPLLKRLECNYSRFETLDLSHNPALEVLSCWSCRNLTKLNLSRNAALRELDISFSGVKKLGLSNRSSLQWVNYQHSHLDAKSEEYLLRIIRQNGGKVHGWEDMNENYKR